MARPSRSRCLTTLLFILFAAGALALPSPARAGEVQLSIGVAGAGSDWRSDGSAAGSLRLGYRFIDLVGIYFLGRLGYGVVDDRLLTCLEAGAQVWGRIRQVRPYARVGLLHMHEEPWSAVQHQPGGAVLGVGDGIRHRTGVAGAVGLDVPVWRRAQWELVATVEATTSWVTYSSGPSWYWGGGVAFGFNYSL